MEVSKYIIYMESKSNYIKSKSNLAHADRGSYCDRKTL